MKEKNGILYSMTHTKQPRNLVCIEEEKNEENPMENLDPKAIFLDSLKKLLVELDDLEKIMEKYYKDKHLFKIKETFHEIEH